MATNRRCGALVAVFVVATIVIGDASAQTDSALAPYRAQREAFVEAFRVEGRIDRDSLAPSIRALESLVQSEGDAPQARAARTGHNAASEQ